MPANRPFSLLRTRDQWSRAWHSGTAIDPATGGVKLDWELLPVTATRAPALGAGLAFDAECRLYHSVPADTPPSASGEARVERLLWKAHDPLEPLERQLQPVDLLAAAPAERLGEFEASAPAPALREPRGLAVDVDDRLFVAESGVGRILVYDLWSRRLLRRAAVGDVGAPGRTALDLAAAGRTVWAVADGPPGLLRLEARSGPRVVELPAGVPVPAGAVPRRVAASPAGDVYLLYRDAADGGWLVPLADPADAKAIPGASDLELLDEQTVVVARRPGEPFAVLRRDREGWTIDTPLAAGGYDGLGIVRTPSGRIGYWSENGFREAVPARVRYVPDGRVVTYRLDSGEFQTQWGRLFLDACIPAGTAVEVNCATSDEGDEEETLAWQPPAKLDAAIPRPDLTPPLCPLSLLAGEDAVWQPLHRRETGRELPWARPAAGDPFETYETPVIADPGRYLWVTLALRGDTRSTPRVKCLRAEHPSHDYLRRLPRTFSRDRAAAAFLSRYLAIFEGALGELDGRSAERDVLLDPRGAPEEVLPWLSSFLGLALDGRWPLAARRAIVADGARLLRSRGTLRGLERFLELALGLEPGRVMIIEHYRLRGLGGALLANEPTPAYTGAVLGETFRVGGAVGVEGEAPLAGTAADAFAAHAHRFSVAIPAVLSTLQVDVVERILAAHRPAHTLFDLCTIGTGMRVGVGLHLGLLSAIGRTGGFTTLQLGSSALGRGAVIGRPQAGTTPEASRLGRDSRVG